MQGLINKKTIIIAVAVLIIGAGAAFYFLRTQSNNGGGIIDTITDFFPSSGEQPGGEPVATPTPEAPGAGNIENTDKGPLSADEVKNLPIGSLIRLTDEEVSSLVPTAQGGVKYHKNIPESLGHLFEKKADGSAEETKSSNYTIPQVLKVVWAPDAMKAVIFYNISGSIRKLWIDYKATSTPKTNALPDSISDVAFSPDSKSMAFINDLGTTRNIFIATFDFKNQKKVADNNLPDLELSWPTASLLAVKTRSSYASTGYLYSVAVKGGIFTKIADGLGLDAVWNNDGTGVLISTVNGGGQIQPLRYIDIKKQTETQLNIETVAEKCTFTKSSQVFAYCAVPKSMPNGRFPDSWWQGLVSLEDNFFSIDITNSVSYAFSTTPSDVIRPTLLPNDSFLLFQDKNTGFLWSMKLK